MTAPTDYGTRLRILRLRAGVSCRRLGKAVGVSYSYLSQQERGVYPCSEYEYFRYVRTLYKIVEGHAAPVREEAVAYHIVQAVAPEPQEDAVRCGK